MVHKSLPCNVLLHEYFGVDLQEVGRAAERDLPEFKRGIEKLLDALGPEAS